MTAHLEVEVLSSYLDRELSHREENRVNTHLERCADCRATLAGLGRVVGRLQTLERQEPPAHLGNQLHRLAALEAARPGLFDRLERGVGKIPLQSSIVPVFAIVVALILIIYMLSWGVHRQATGRIPVHLEPPAGTASSIEPPPDQQVGGRTFSFVDGVWIEAGLAPIDDAEAMSVADPRVQSGLAQTPAMREIVSLGNRVRLRMGDRVVEIRFDTE